jgi:Homeodomain-like domain
MRYIGHTLTGGLHGSHIPVPTTARTIQHRPTPRGFAWGSAAGPDPDAITRLIAAGVLTATPELIDNKPVRVVRKAPPVRTRRTLIRDATTGRPRREMDDEGMVAAYRAGASIKGLARTHRAAAQTIRARLELHGVYVRPSGGSGPKVDTADILRLLATGITQAETARRLGVSERTIRNHRRKAGM